MKINIASVINCDGAKLDIEKEFPIGSFEFAGNEYSFEKPVKVTGEIRNIGSALRIILNVWGEYTAFCDRCGCDVTKSVASATEEDITEGNDDFDEEMFSIVGHTLDISGAVESLVYSSLPMRNLCSDDCKGLCPKCGTDLNKSECNCDTTRYDPRFAIFRKLAGNGEV
ncbi:MAG: YceD family protein [Clostridia bacterium]